MINWLLSNKEWLFSGIGVTILAIIVGFFLKKRKKSSSYQNQSTKGSGQSIQAGRDVSITHNHEDTKKNDEMIRIASLDEVQEFDPRIKKLRLKIKKDCSDNIDTSESFSMGGGSHTFNSGCLKWIVWIVIVLLGIYWMLS